MQKYENCVQMICQKTWSIERLGGS